MIRFDFSKSGTFVRPFLVIRSQENVCRSAATIYSTHWEGTNLPRTCSRQNRRPNIFNGGLYVCAGVL